MTSFGEALCDDHEVVVPQGLELPDPNDVHVVATAVKVGASVIVTDNIKDFPRRALATLDVEVKSTDAFIADTLDLPEGHRAAVAAIRRMRERLKRPELTPEELLLRMESNGLLASANILREHIDSL